ncbi:DUF1127 domain-containing protein [Sulfitobacter sp.]|uniref:DUF1127 domain-containing protein n=1 Tax=Sulfitobacter sp. TaxID=1903071 RepID=UPI00300217B9
MRIFLPTLFLQPSSARCATSRPSLLNLLAIWRSRRALASLSENQLQDIGISRPEARTEAARPIWDAPTSWTC